jgi:aspartate/methionine/tyrosine aminotransferase
VLIHDAPYTELTFGEYRAPSVLETPGAMARAIELHSCSKTYHLPGLRIGWAAGNADLVAALAAVKGQFDFNQYLGIQQAATAALVSDPARVRRRSAFEAARCAPRGDGARQLVGVAAPPPMSGRHCRPAPPTPSPFASNSA